jgi:hypothetical protein
MQNSTWTLAPCLPAACHASAVSHFHHPIVLSPHPFYETRQRGGTNTSLLHGCINCTRTGRFLWLHGCPDLPRQVWATMQKPVEESKLGREDYRFILWKEMSVLVLIYVNSRVVTC